MITCLHFEVKRSKVKVTAKFSGEDRPTGAQFAIDDHLVNVSNHTRIQNKKNWQSVTVQLHLELVWA